MDELINLEEMPEQLEDNSVLVYSNGVLKQIKMPEFGELLLKVSDGKVAYSYYTKQNKW